MLRRLFYALPLPLKYAARWCYFWPLDMVNWLSGKQHPMVPPMRMCFTGSGDFIRIGEHYLSLFQQYGGLQAHHQVLDIGSGLGRMALPFTHFLSAEGRYCGIDVVPKGVKWCQEHYKAYGAQFRFDHAYLHNSLYTGTDAADASTYRFAYQDQSFDFVWLTSVFTHMLPAEVSNYLAEISRMLKPGGRCLFTLFLIPKSDPGRRLRTAGFDFPHLYSTEPNAASPIAWVMDLNTPHANVAFAMDWIDQELANHGLVIKHQLLGYWDSSNPANGIDFQDIIVVEKV